MTITVFWDNPEKTILRQIYRSGYTQEQYYDAVSRCAELLEHVPHPVDVISEFHTWPDEARPAAEPLTQVLLQINYDALSALRSQRAGTYRLVHSLQEAYAAIAEYRGAARQTAGLN